MSGGTPARRLSDQDLFDWVRLIRSENVGPRGFQALLRRYGGARAALEALPGLARRVDGKRTLKIADSATVDAEMSAAAQKGVRFVARCDFDYPPMLARIDDAPPVLAVQGHIAALQEPMIAIVGSRNASAGGLAFADRLARFSTRRPSRALGSLRRAPQGRRLVRPHPKLRSSRDLLRRLRRLRRRRSVAQYASARRLDVDLGQARRRAGRLPERTARLSTRASQRARALRFKVQRDARVRQRDVCHSA